MKLNLKILLSFLLILIILGIFATLNQTKTPNINKVQTATEEVTLSPQINSEGGVEVQALPSVSSDKKTWSSEITLTTHSGSLDEDLAKISTLTNEKGEELIPLGWEGSPPGGHHRQGVLTFDSFLWSPKLVTLTLKSIAGIERTFSWEVK